MNISNCSDEEGLKQYQHNVYAIVYGVILAPGLLGNVLALWVFRIYIRETKRAVVFMMNLAIADLLQVLSLPLRIYYYLNDSWPFGYPLCMICFYLKYVNMYASIYFLVWISVRRCQLIVDPLKYNSSKQKGDLLKCIVGWVTICLACLAFPVLRDYKPDKPNDKCFSELPMRPIGYELVCILLILAELLGFIIPLIVVLACAVLTALSLRKTTAECVPDCGEKRRALKMVLCCAVVFLLCFAPYHITMPLDFLVKANIFKDCSLRNQIQRSHIITLCLASLNCSLDPLMYYFTSDEFRRRLSRPEMPDTLTFNRRLSCLTGGEDAEDE
ncbi:probable G-protein coupled receptor 174 [Cyprinodon tularosa]|uniref:probable G-protein coupled receptor 174 n=1 Tax=Cyprinodon tularosa TaxID=77115 RepID=UPI0018E289C6|nr:probable G-protein coupled receptor 174 [Cyprinodon tularosa]